MDLLFVVAVLEVVWDWKRMVSLLHSYLVQSSHSSTISIYLILVAVVTVDFDSQMLFARFEIQSIQYVQRSFLIYLVYLQKNEVIVRVVRMKMSTKVDDLWEKNQTVLH